MPLKPSMCILAAASILLAACSPEAVLIWTDTPEVVVAVELYNASQDERVVELSYVSDLASTLLLAETPPDLAIGTYIENAVTARGLAPLDRFLRRVLDETAFYANLLASGRRSGRQVAIPISFSLPLVYSSGEVRAFDEPIAITPEVMRERAEAFNRSNEGLFTRISYSPVWEPDFLYQLARLQGLNPRQEPAGTPVWDFESLVSSISYAREWIDEHGGTEETRRFADRYLYDPQIQLVKSGRVEFGYSTSSEYLSRSDARRSDLTFYWLSGERGIHVLEDVVFAAIPGEAGNRQGAEQFLSTILSEDFQRALLESSIAKRVDEFGLLGGFSSLWRVNRSVLPDYFPSLENRVPPPDSLVFAPASPRHWGEIVSDVVEPWLVREVLGQTQSRDLEEAVRAWLLQQEN